MTRYSLFRVILISVMELYKYFKVILWNQKQKKREGEKQQQKASQKPSWHCQQFTEVKKGQDPERESRRNHDGKEGEESLQG